MTLKKLRTQTWMGQIRCRTRDSTHRNNGLHTTAKCIAKQINHKLCIFHTVVLLTTSTLFIMKYNLTFDILKFCSIFLCHMFHLFLEMSGSSSSYSSPPPSRIVFLSMDKTSPVSSSFTESFLFLPALSSLLDVFQYLAK
jgi:hypothetical protein